MRKILFVGLGLLLSSFMITGCAASCKSHRSSDETCSRSQEMKMRQDLKSHGVKLVFLGDHLFVSLPVTKVFRSSVSNVISHQGARALKHIAEFLRCYQMIAVKVIVRTDVLQCPAENAAFSKLQAKKVSEYLWQQGLHAQMISANSDSVYRKGVREIEIVTQKIP